MAAGSLEHTAMPLDSVVRALRRLAPGAALREPPTPELRILADAVRRHPVELLGERHPNEVTAALLTHQLAVLDQAMTGFLGPEGAPRPESARLIRAARFSGGRRSGPPPPLLPRLRAEPGLRAAATSWAEAIGFRVLTEALRRTCRPATPTPEDVRLAASLAVGALLPRAPRLVAEPCTRWQPVRPVPGPYGAVLDVMTLVLGGNGFEVAVASEEPVGVERTGSALSLRAIRWTGLTRVGDDLGYEYLVLARDHRPGDGAVLHRCHPHPVAGASELRLESGGYRAEELRFDAGCAGRPTRTTAEIPVKIELTASLRG